MNVHLPSLRQIKSVNLSKYQGLIDLEKLRNIKIVNLSHTGIKDVSSLGNVKELNLSYCDKITFKVGTMFWTS